MEVRVHNPSPPPARACRHNPDDNPCTTCGFGVPPNPPGHARARDRVAWGMSQVGTPVVNPKLPPPMCGPGKQIVQIVADVFRCVLPFSGLCPPRYFYKGKYHELPVCSPPDPTRERARPRGLRPRFDRAFSRLHARLLRNPVVRLGAGLSPTPPVKVSLGAQSVTQRKDAPRAAPVQPRGGGCDQVFVECRHKVHCPKGQICSHDCECVDKPTTITAGGGRGNPVLATGPYSMAAVARGTPSTPRGGLCFSCPNNWCCPSPCPYRPDGTQANCPDPRSTLATRPGGRGNPERCCPGTVCRGDKVIKCCHNCTCVRSVTECDLPSGVTSKPGVPSPLTPAPLPDMRAPPPPPELVGRHVRPLGTLRTTNPNGPMILALGPHSQSRVGVPRPPTTPRMVFWRDCSSWCNEKYQHAWQFHEWDDCVDNCREQWAWWPGRGKGNPTPNPWTTWWGPGLGGPWGYRPPSAPAVPWGAWSYYGNVWPWNGIAAPMPNPCPPTPKQQRRQAKLDMLNPDTPIFPGPGAHSKFAPLPPQWFYHQRPTTMGAPYAGQIPTAAPGPPPGVFGRGGRCYSDLDCKADTEYCHMGICLPKPWSPHENPVDTLCHCDGPHGTNCKCTVCWQQKRGAAYKPSCIQFPVPDKEGAAGTVPHGARLRAATPPGRLRNPAGMVSITQPLAPGIPLR